MKAFALCLTVSAFVFGVVLDAAKAAPQAGGKGGRPAVKQTAKGRPAAALQNNGARPTVGQINAGSFNANALVGAAAAVRRTAIAQPNFGGGAGFNVPGYAAPYGRLPYSPGFNLGYQYGLLNNSAFMSRSTAPIRPTPDSTLLIGVATVPSEEAAAGVKRTVPSRQISAGIQRNGKATMQVIPPTADADIAVEGGQTANMGRERLFITPTLEAGYRYSYTIVATWSKDGQPKRDSRTIEVTPGLTTTIDFTRPAVPELLPMPMKVERDQF